MHNHDVISDVIIMIAFWFACKIFNADDKSTKIKCRDVR